MSHIPHEERWRQHIDAARQAGLHRKLRTFSSSQGAEILAADGTRLVNFSSNDYLGLAAHPALTGAAERALRDYGMGSGASRLISGGLSPHRELEEKLASFKGVESALVFSSGYAAALGTIPALVGKDDFILLDKLSHACLVDAARLSGATLRVFPHNHMDRLASQLAWCSERRKPGANVLIVTESVFSMDGDVPPLAEIVGLAEEFDAFVLLDEAHGTGTVGRAGRGLADALDLTRRVAIHMGTLSKALGCSGGYIAGSATLTELLVNKARSFIFSTAPPPSVSAAALAALNLLDSPEGVALVATLQKNIRLAAELGGMTHQNDFPTPILPVILGSEETALVASLRAANDHGLLLPAIRFPTVARGMARLRVSIRADHSAEHIRRLGDFLAACRPR